MKLKCNNGLKPADMSPAEKRNAAIRFGPHLNLLVLPSFTDVVPSTSHAAVKAELFSPSLTLQLAGEGRRVAFTGGTNLHTLQKRVLT